MKLGRKLPRFLHSLHPNIFYLSYLIHTFRHERISTLELLRVPYLTELWWEHQSLALESQPFFLTGKSSTLTHGEG